MCASKLHRRCMIYLAHHLFLMHVYSMLMLLGFLDGWICLVLLFSSRPCMYILVKQLFSLYLGPVADSDSASALDSPRHSSVSAR